VSWKSIELAKACEVFSDGDWIESKDQSDSGIRLIQTGNIGFGKFKARDSKARFINEETFKRLRCTEIKEGDLLVSRLPDPVGRACIIPQLVDKSITAVDCTIIRTKQEILNSNYLNYYCQSQQYFEQVEKNITGATRQRISRSLLGKTLVPLPHLQTQQKIVSKLDTIFAEMDKAQVATEANIKNAEALFQSYLTEVFESGGKGWIEKKLKEITTKIGSGATPRGGNDSYKETGISLIRSMNVYDEGFYYPKLAFIDETQAKELANVTIEKDDILLNITGGSVARCCVVPSDVLPARVNQHVSIIRVDKNFIYPKLVNFLLISPLHKKRLLNVGEGGGSTRQAITKAQLQEYSISFPASLGLQKELIQKIEEFYLTTFNIEKSYKEKFHNLPLLKQSILQQAFSGELVKD
jgi:type I restriction enzyme S subunit